MERRWLELLARGAGDETALLKLREAAASATAMGMRSEARLCEALLAELSQPG